MRDFGIFGSGFLSQCHLQPFRLRNMWNDLCLQQFIDGLPWGFASDRLLSRGSIMTAPWGIERRRLVGMNPRDRLHFTPTFPYSCLFLLFAKIFLHKLGRIEYPLSPLLSSQFLVKNRLWIFLEASFTLGLVTIVSEQISDGFLQKRRLYWW